MKVRIIQFLTACVIGLSTGVTSAQVVSVFPAAQSLTATRTDEIRILFDRPMNPALFDLTTFHVFGRWSGTASGTFAFEEDNTLLRFVSERPFISGEWVTVTLARSIEAMDGTPMESGYAWSYWIRTAPGEIDQQNTGTLSTRSAGEGTFRSYGA